jgi:hypothetical protein
MKQPFVFAMVLMVASCGYEDSRMAHQAQINMVGMTAADLQSCAGVPDKAKKIDDRTEIFTYSLKNDSVGGVEVSLPVIGGGYRIGSSGSSCHAHVRMTDNRVASIFYSGNNDQPIGQDGVCAPIIRGCMRRPQSSMLPPTDETRAQSSAYRQPQAPPTPAGN